MKILRRAFVVSLIFVLTLSLCNFCVLATGISTVSDSTAEYFPVYNAEEFEEALVGNASSKRSVVIDVLDDIEITESLASGKYKTSLTITSSNESSITVSNCTMIMHSGNLTSTSNGQDYTFSSININLVGDQAAVFNIGQEVHINLINSQIDGSDTSSILFDQPGDSSARLYLNIYSGSISSGSGSIFGDITVTKEINIYPEGDISISGSTGVEQVNIYPASEDYSPITAKMGNTSILNDIEAATSDNPATIDYESPLVISASADTDTDTGNSGSTSTENPYTVSISAEETTFKPEDTFEVEVQISGDAFAGFDVCLEFDPSVIKAKNVIFTDEEATVKDTINNGDTSTDEDVVGTVEFSSTGDERDASENAVTVAIVEFEAVGDGSSNIEITKAKVVPEGPSMDYNATATAGENLIITVKTVKYTVKEGYAPGYNLIVYNTQSAEAGNVLEYNGTEMYYDWNDDGQVVWLLVVPQNEDVSDLFVTTEEKAVLQIYRDGNVNGDNDVDIVDAQIVYDFGVKGGIYDLSDASMTVWLNADVNGDYQVDGSDSLAIQELIHSN